MLTYKETDNVNIPIYLKEIKHIVNKLPMKKTLGQDVLPAEFYQIFQEEIIPTLTNSSKTLRRRGYFLTDPMK